MFKMCKRATILEEALHALGEAGGIPVSVEVLQWAPGIGERGGKGGEAERLARRRRFSSWRSACSPAGRPPASGCLSSPCGNAAPSQPGGLRPAPSPSKPALWKGPPGYSAPCSPSPWPSGSLCRRPARGGSSEPGPPGGNGHMQGSLGKTRRYAGGTLLGGFLASQGS